MKVKAIAKPTADRCSVTRWMVCHRIAMWIQIRQLKWTKRERERGRQREGGRERKKVARVERRSNERATNGKSKMNRRKDETEIDRKAMIDRVTSRRTSENGIQSWPARGDHDRLDCTFHRFISGGGWKRWWASPICRKKSPNYDDDGQAVVPCWRDLRKSFAKSLLFRSNRKWSETKTRKCDKSKIVENKKKRGLKIRENVRPIFSNVNNARTGQFVEW